MKSIPVKNYFVLVLIIIVSGFIALVIMNLFKNYNNPERKNIFQNKILFEELETYMLENPNFIVYLASTSLNDSKFEKKFQKFIVSNDLVNDVIYINRDNMNDLQFQDYLSNYLYEDKKVTLSDCIMVIDDQTIKAIIPITKEFNDMETIKRTFKEQGVL